MTNIDKIINANLLIVDYQNCFTQRAIINGIANRLAGALYVNGSENDVERISAMIVKYIDQILSIAITGDFHPSVMISFPNYWVDVNGNNPAPFTVISVTDVETGVWRTADPNNQEWGLYYVRQMELNNKTKTNNFFELRIWPYHAIAGTDGANFDAVLLDALAPYMDSKVTVVMKGMNPHTEQQGALEADVVVASDTETARNSQLAKWLDNALANGGDILMAGEALDICFAYTVYSILNYLPEDTYNKLVILTDAASPIYPELGVKFLDDMNKIGIRTSTTTEYFVNG